MKRRNFLQQSSLGILGLSVPAGVLRVADLQSFSSRVWMSRFVEALGGRRRSLLAIPAGLAHQIEQYNAFQAKNGFWPEESGVFYISTDSTYCIYPLVMRHRPSGTAELLVPIFQKGPDQTWRRLATLNGYQLEALSHAAQALNKVPVPLQDVLLPLGCAHKGNTLVLLTREGHVAVKSRLIQGSASTSIQVVHRDALVFESTIDSKHCLSATPFLPAHA